MDKHYFLNAGIPPPLHFDPSPSAMPTWQPLTPAPELNFSPDQPSNCFPNRGWEKSTEQYAHLESALSSLVSSPGASNSAVSGDGLAIRELIGKLGSICNAGEISPSLLAATSYIGGGNGSANTSCYSTPMNSPPKLNIPIMDHFLEENLNNFGTSTPLNSALPAVSADPGFAERAAKFSCFGSRSFNGRTSQFGMNNAEFKYRPSNPLMGNGNLPRVSSSPSLKASMGGQENNNSAQTQKEMCSSNAPVSVPDKKFSRFSGSAANSNEDSSVSEQIPNDLNSRKRKAVSKGKANATKEVEADEDLNAKRSKQTQSRGNEMGDAKTEEETADEDQKVAKAGPKPPEPPKDYIHVRARRGQATDSHSLAERVRREKISERMKLLQDLVPGCNKVTGKALMLDEIINYVQSLQRQVEFLSMKLASVNPRLDFNMDSLLSKDTYQPNGTLPHPNYPLDSSASALYGHHPHQNPLVHTNISSGAMSQGTVDPLDATLCCNLGLQLPSVDGFGEGLPQFPTFCEDDLQSIVQMAFGENPNRDTDFQSQAQNQTPHMKIEL